MSEKDELIEHLQAETHRLAQIALAADAEATRALADAAEHEDETRLARARTVELQETLSEHERTINRQLDVLLNLAEEIEELKRAAKDHASALAAASEAEQRARAAGREAQDQLRDTILRTNQQLQAMSQAAALRDEQVSKLARLWDSTYGQGGAPTGVVLTRQLNRVFADHGIDITNMPEPRKAGQESVDHAILKVEHARLLLAASKVVKHAKGAYVSNPEQLGVAIGSLRCLVEAANNG